jgi:hypothetical protein
VGKNSKLLQIIGDINMPIIAHNIIDDGMLLFVGWPAGLFDNLPVHFFAHI